MNTDTNKHPKCLQYRIIFILFLNVFFSADLMRLKDGDPGNRQSACWCQIRIKTTKWKSNTLCHTVFFHILIWLHIFLISLNIRLLLHQCLWILLPTALFAARVPVMKIISGIIQTLNRKIIRTRWIVIWFVDSLLFTKECNYFSFVNFYFLFVYNFIQMW